MNKFGDSPQLQPTDPSALSAYLYELRGRMDYLCENEEGNALQAVEEAITYLTLADDLSDPWFSEALRRLADIQKRIEDYRAHLEREMEGEVRT